MKCVFADSVYWIALASSRDQWHEQALRANQSLSRVEVVPSHEVLNEFLTAFRHNAVLRGKATRIVDGLWINPSIRILPLSDRGFREGYDFYKERPDKQYSLTDCISMQAMRRESINEILSNDDHFSQEGFTLLM